MSITAISFYRRNDTPSFITWRCRLATAPDTPTCIVIHGGQFTGGVHPPSQFVPEIVSPLPCSPALVRHLLLIVYIFKELISFIGSLDKCHTSVFDALISLMYVKRQQEITVAELNIDDSEPRHDNSHTFDCFVALSYRFSRGNFRSICEMKSLNASTRLK